MGIFGLVEDIAKIAIAPVEIAADLTRVVTKPLADMAEEVADEISDIVEDD
jgi:hypothetical protein